MAFPDETSVLAPAKDGYETLHSGLTVRMIITSRDRVMTCFKHESIDEVRRRNVNRFDYIPVVEAHDEGSEWYVGLLHAAGIPFDSSSLRVSDLIIPLNEKYIIGADSSVLDFLMEADERPCRLVISGSQIIGLVSLSDVQKLPVRAALFALITGFEMTASEYIKRTLPHANDWLELLPPARRDLLHKEMSKAHSGDAFVESLLFTQFADKKTILKKIYQGRHSKGWLEKLLSAAEDLRNRLAHANDYASTMERARNLCAVMRNLRELRGELHGQLYAQGQANS